MKNAPLPPSAASDVQILLPEEKKRVPFPGTRNWKKLGLIDIQEWRNNMPELVETINNVLLQRGAPVRVRMTENGRGYGLFAERDIQPGEAITTYGGLIYPEADRVGDYVIEGIGESFDAERFFFPQEAGRFINEPPYYEEWLVNVEGRKPKGSGPYVFVARNPNENNPIKKGQELLIQYGKQYQRTWNWKNIVAQGNRNELTKLKEYFENQLELWQERSKSNPLGASSILRSLKSALQQVEEALNNIVVCQVCGNRAQSQYTTQGYALCDSPDCAGALSWLLQ